MYIHQHISMHKPTPQAANLQSTHPSIIHWYPYRTVLICHTMLREESPWKYSTPLFLHTSLLILLIPGAEHNTIIFP